jgi:hypothetical protein
MHIRSLRILFNRQDEEDARIVDAKACSLRLEACSRSSRSPQLITRSFFRSSVIVPSSRFPKEKIHRHEQRQSNEGHYQELHIVVACFHVGLYGAGSVVLGKGGQAEKEKTRYGQTFHGKGLEK